MTVVKRVYEFSWLANRKPITEEVTIAGPVPQIDDEIAELREIARSSVHWYETPQEKTHSNKIDVTVRAVERPDAMLPWSTRVFRICLPGSIFWVSRQALHPAAVEDTDQESV